MNDSHFGHRHLLQFAIGTQHSKFKKFGGNNLAVKILSHSGYRSGRFLVFMGQMGFEEEVPMVVSRIWDEPGI